MLLTFYETLFLLELIGTNKLGLDSDISFVAQNMSNKLRVAKRGGLEFILNDGAVVEED